MQSKKTRLYLTLPRGSEAMVRRLAREEGVALADMLRSIVQDGLLRHYQDRRRIEGEDAVAGPTYEWVRAVERHLQLEKTRLHFSTLAPEDPGHVRGDGAYIPPEEPDWDEVEELEAPDEPEGDALFE